MRYLYRGTTLGVFLFLFSTIYSYDDRHEAILSVSSTAPYNHQYQCNNQHNQSGFTFYVGANNFALRGVMRSYINSPEYQQACLQAAQEKKDKQKAEAEEYLEKFGVTKEELWGEGRSCGIFSGTFDDVSRRICQMSVEKKQALAMWHEYCTQKRTGVWFLDGLKEEGRQKILKAYEKREKKEKQEKQRQDNLKKQEEQKRQQHYQYIYHENIIAFSDEQSSYLNDRQLALQQTKEDNYQQHEKSYDVEPDAQALGIKPEQFKKLSGTLFQHQLFGEIAQCYKKTVRIVFENQIRNSIFVPSILEFAQSSFQAVGCQQFALAMQLNDLCDTLAETSLSFCKGAISSVCDFVDLYILHPKQTAKEFAKMFMLTMRILGGALAAYDTETPMHSQSLQVMQDQFQQDLEIFNTMCAVSRQSYEQWKESSSGQQKVEAVSKVALDLIMHPMLAGKIMKGCWGVLHRAGQLSGPLERVITTLEEVGNFITESSQVATHEELFATATTGDIEQSLLHLTQAEIDTILTIKTPFKMWPVEKMVQGIRKYNNKIPAHETELIANLAYFLEKQSQKFNAKISSKVRKSYKNFEKVINGKKALVEPDIDHIANAGYYVKEMDNINYYKVVSYNGGHLAGTVKELEKLGLIIIKEEHMLQYGCKHYVVEDLLVGRIVEKTEFPKSWGVDKIMEKVIEAFDNIYKIKPGNKEERIMFFGKTNEGIKIQLILDEIETGYKLVTAIPY